MSLYETTNDMRELQAMADTGELSESDIADTMEGLNIEFNDQVTACLKVRLSLLDRVNNIDDEISRLEQLKKAPANNAEGIKKFIKSRMALLNKDKIKLPLFDVTLKKSFEKLGELDEKKIPKKFFIKIPATKKLDKKMLLSAAKLKKVKGVELVESERALLIK